MYGNYLRELYLNKDLEGFRIIVSDGLTNGARIKTKDVLFRTKLM
jgi:hypothetical protein